MKTDKIIVIAVIAFLAYLLLRGHSLDSGHSLSVNLLGLGTAKFDASLSYCNIHGQPMESSNCAIPLSADYLPCSHCYKPAISCFTARMVCDNSRAQRGTQTYSGVCSFNQASALPHDIGVTAVDPGLIDFCGVKQTPYTICVEPVQQGGII